MSHTLSQLNLSLSKVIRDGRKGASRIDNSVIEIGVKMLVIWYLRSWRFPILSVYRLVLLQPVTRLVAANSQWTAASQEIENFLSSVAGCSRFAVYYAEVWTWMNLKHEALKKKGMKTRICPIVKQIWILSF